MITTNTGAKKLEASDNWREIFPNPGTGTAGAHNASVDAADRIQAEVAPIINGKQCALGAASGDYVLLRNSTITGKSDGAYIATKAIPANTDIDSTYLGNAITGGISNSLNNKFTMQQVTPTNVRSSLNIDSNNSYSLGNLVVINIRCTATANIAAGNTIFDIPTPTHNGINGDSVCARFPIILDSGTGSQYGYYNGNGHVYTTSQLNQGEYYYINFVYRKS